MNDYLWSLFPDFDLDQLKECLEEIKRKYNYDETATINIIKSLYPKIRKEVKCNVNNILTFDHMFSNKYKKDIYLIGETHVIKECKEISIDPSLFFERIILSTDKIIDFFIETSFIKIGKITSLSHLPSKLGETADFFRKCLLPKKDCPYKNLRAHYANVRRLSSTDIFETILRRVDFENVLKRKNQLINELNKIIKANILEETKVLKQFSFIKDETTRKLFLKEALDVELKIKEKAKDFLDYFKGKDFSHPRFYSHLFNSFTDETVKLQDLYMLGRIFRDFKDAPSPKNIIIYAGYTHNNNIIEIFQNLGFNHKVFADLQKQDCVDFSPSLPWFKNNF